MSEELKGRRFLHMVEKNYMFAFVILHYNVLQETLRCIQSIKDNVCHSIYKIIVVDNASPNKTGKELEKKFAEDPIVSVILNDKNLGFANGNNVGIDFARKTFKADFVIALNNDTYLLQKNFTQVIENEWRNSFFAVMGPKVHTPAGINQNPVPFEINNKNEIRKRIIRYSFAYARAALGIDGIYFSLKQKAKKILHHKNDVVTQNQDKQHLRQENVKLHGCCLVFSPKFFDFFDGFDPKTFMYLEEDILIAHLRQKKLLSVYNPLLQIFHDEMVATKSLSETNRRKQLFVYGEYLRSLKILKKFINSAEE